MRRLLLSTCAFGLFAIFGTANAGSPAVLPGTSYAVPVDRPAIWAGRTSVARS